MSSRRSYRIVKRRFDGNKNFSQKIEKEIGDFNWLDTSLIIGYSTILGYLIAYSFQKGYLDYYGITNIFISQINIVNIIISITVVGTSLFYLYIAYNNLSGILSHGSNPYIQIFKERFLPFLVVGFLLGALDPEWIKIISLLLFIILITIYLVPIAKYKEIKGYGNKLKQEIKYLDEEGFTLKNVMLSVKKVPSFRIFIIVATLTVLPSLSNLFGYNQAKRETDYVYFTNERNNYLIIDRSGDNFIIAPFDVKKNLIEQKFQIIEIKSDMEKPFVYNKITIKDGLRIFKNKSGEKR
ncbi:hypothetical protein ShirakiTB12_39520 [Priestia megaterium]|uniref:Uncharacterized protein n=1 Tax=Priestia megaterium TaxID=1404 RepID=A0AAX6BP51_PRIMG|nr:hypothetical protein [Priestia megaterium]GMG75484.1 hypothetical protein ShirakiTB12_39520 [Priestia megaterium]